MKKEEPIIIIKSDSRGDVYQNRINNSVEED
jgi:hypothetical protein